MASIEKEQEATTADWIILLVIVAAGGSSFAMIRGAVESVPPMVVTIGRLWVGAAFLYLVMRQAGRRFPPFFEGERRSISREWRWIIPISVIGYVAPFSIFPWAQQYIESGLAGVYMAFMPIWTVLLAYLFAGESLGPRKVIGFLLGFAGVVILMGPSVVGGVAQSSFFAQASLLAATIFYAAYAVSTRRAPPILPRAFAAATLLSAAIIATPILFFVELRTNEWTFAGVANVIGLGVLPTGLAGVLLIMLIKRVGAGFMALANYLTPVWAVGAGAVIFGERLEPSVFAALAVILAGVAISQSKPRARKQAAASINQTEI